MEKEAGRARLVEPWVPRQATPGRALIAITAAQGRTARVTVQWRFPFGLDMGDLKRSYLINPGLFRKSETTLSSLHRKTVFPLTHRRRAESLQGPVGGQSKGQRASFQLAECTKDR